MTQHGSLHVERLAVFLFPLFLVSVILPIFSIYPYKEHPSDGLVGYPDVKGKYHGFLCWLILRLILAQGIYTRMYMVLDAEGTAWLPMGQFGCLGTGCGGGVALFLFGLPYC